MIAVVLVIPLAVTFEITGGGVLCTPVVVKLIGAEYPVAPLAAVDWQTK
jgi:hypothetical protein